MLAAALGIAAAVAGVTGAWSPCGFSMVDTIGRSEGGRAPKAAACMTFTLGALLGGAVTFGSLGALGDAVHGSGGWLAVAPAVTIALAAALGEARGVRIVPQIRRQVPERWRRVLPLPVAVAGYGVLLGLGFTTFVLTLGVWALAAISFALGDFRLGLTVGLAFGAGRALLVAFLAPLAERPIGIGLGELMTERTGFLRASRLANAVVLAGCAAVLMATGASGAVVVARSASDPSFGAGLLAWDAGTTSVVRVGPDRLMVIEATDPALGGSLLAWLRGSTASVIRLDTFEPVLEVQLTRPDAIAVSDRWLVYRNRRPDGGDRIAARSLDTPSLERTIASVRPSVSLGRPSIDGDVVVYGAANKRWSWIVAADLSGGGTQVVRRSDLDQLANPSLLAGMLLYVRSSNRAQRLMLGPVDSGRDRTLYELGPPAMLDPGYEGGYSHKTRTPPVRPPAPFLLWTTALAPTEAFVSLIPRNGGRAGARIVQVAR
ncbi:MAG: hypothetical protein M3R70_10260 [Actinomycetota bacterium]|nr:hypothetical protein [Actinomycetota bacterium]